MQTIGELFNLTGKVAIVTGGAMGIGKGIALRMAEAGAAVMISDINEEAARKTVEEIKTSGGKAAWVIGNTAQISDAEKVVQAADKEFGRLDILVNNAGIYKFMPALNMTEELWDRTIDVNLKGVMFFSKAAANAMISAGHGGKIINIASIDAFHPTGNLSQYDASKGGVVMLTKALAVELAPHGILVNAIAPGGISTPGAAAMSSTSMSPEMVKAYVQRLPLKRMGDPDDIGKVALFLASSASDYMVGDTIIVDGGTLLV
jgi:2-dehydro-3-deoxy-D-gluconate 5-dehydrogenase